MYAAIAALFIAMPQQGMAQEVYGLKIAGVAVTSENCNDLSVIKGVTGNAKYDNESKKLTLDGATIHATSAHGLENRIDGLIIRVTNENSITSDKKVGIWKPAAEVMVCMAAIGHSTTATCAPKVAARAIATTRAALLGYGTEYRPSPIAPLLRLQERIGKKLKNTNILTSIFTIQTETC